MHVLITALDGRAGARISDCLTVDGHAVDAEPDGAQLAARLADAVRAGLPHAVLLGVARACVAPVTRLHALRAVTPVAPLVVVGALPEGEVAAALHAGADDVVPLSVGCGELTWRLDALWRRAGAAVVLLDPLEPLVRCVAPGVLLDDGRRVALRGGVATRLTACEYAVLRCLADHSGAVVPREAVVSAVWGPERPGVAPNGDLDGGAGHSPGGDWVGTRAVDRHVATLRRKLGDSARRPTILRTVRGVGYQLAAPAAWSPGDK